MIVIGDLNLASRESLVASLPHGLRGAEIGVLNGDFAETMLNCKPSHLMLVDIWECPPGYGVTRASVESINHDYMRHYFNVIKRFSGTTAIAIRAESKTAAEFTQDKYLDWIYIDADHMHAGAYFNHRIGKPCREIWIENLAAFDETFPLIQGQ